ncbi:MAG: porin family protein [Planctomycetota bacterium]|jgi:hypothetical protein
MKKLAAAMTAVVLGVVLAGHSAHAYSSAYRSSARRPRGDGPRAGSPTGGFRIGVNFAKVTGDLADFGIDESKLGFTVGATADVPVTGAVSFQTGLLYTQKGGEGSIDASSMGPFFPPGTTFDFEVALDYLEVPLLLKVAPEGGGAYLLGGLSLGLNVRAELTVEYEGSTSTDDMGEYTEDAELSLVVGAGISSADGRATVGVQYSLGVTDLDEGPDGEMKTETLSVMAGVAF